ncbi:caveolin 3 [Mytilus galloprovincialis]|uniref:Caveolin n=1 Tax=Mytilus galloprovincialis TaxID=29158 RepID=A0A8B6FDT8_MYTGA|nr:caveolin 3 [Mytilus galloprovincialis]
MGNLFSENQKQTTFQLDDMGVKEETIVNGGTDNGFDLINRDPNSINSHVKVAFEDILGEPDSVHSLNCVWKFSYICFNFWQRLCYIILTTCCGICIAAQWGCEFGYIAFSHVWCITPMFKVMEINCGCLQRIYGVCVHCCFDPLCESFGLLFGNFRRPYQ